MSRGEALLAWYHGHRRDLPWRDTADPYRILVSEVMLQQTQAARVVPFYDRFLGRFPVPQALATAPLAAVLDAWQGLGYPSRARRLRAAVQSIVRRGWPRSVEGLLELPGVGPYTAAAVASFSLDVRVAVVDTNVRRVLSRWHGEPLKGEALLLAADEAIHEDAAAWNQAIMELGALVCRPRAPRCDECPVASGCADPGVYEAPPRQAPYRGSDREVRGAVLRALLASGRMPIDDLAASAGHPAERVEEVVHRLSAAALIEQDGSQVRLAN